MFTTEQGIQKVLNPYITWVHILHVESYIRRLPKCCEKKKKSHNYSLWEEKGTQSKQKKKVSVKL